MSPFCEMGGQGTALGAVNINQSKQALSKISQGGLKVVTALTRNANCHLSVAVCISHQSRFSLVYKSLGYGALSHFVESLFSVPSFFAFSTAASTSFNRRVSPLFTAT
jgi:hypothetical protein